MARNCFKVFLDVRFGLSFHVLLFPFLFPAALFLRIAGPEGAKNLAVESPPPDSNPFNDYPVLKNLASLSRQFAAKGESPIRVPQTQSAFHPRARRNAFRRRDVRQQSRSFAPRNPRLIRSPKLQPRFLRLSAMISPVLHALILPLVPFHRKTALCQKYLFTALPQPRV
jgi:hypothetical protein